jgi:mono/diheme cytochrome c family protein
MSLVFRLVAAALFISFAAAHVPVVNAQAQAKKDKEPETVSYYKDVRPILQQHCQGCHQPAKAQGGFLMINYADLFKKSDKDNPGVVAGHPEQSEILRQITPQAGKRPEMPRGKDPLSDRDVRLITRWISQGAKDDTPASAHAIVVDMEHPPSYELAPVITSLAYSPDNSLLAVAGYHEVLLCKADGSGVAARLVGLSERIQSRAV